MRAAVKYETVEGWQHERSPSVEMISEMKPPRSLDRCAHVRCQEPCSGVAEWVQCEACTKWYHDICVFKGPTSPRGEPWFCSACMADGLEHCQKLMELNKRNGGGNQAQEQGGSSDQHVQQQQPSSSAVAGPSRDRRLSSASTASFKTQTSGSRANVDHPQPTSPASPPLPLLLTGPNSPSPSSANVVKQEQNMAAAVPMPANGEKAVVHIQLQGGPDGLAMDRLERYHFNGQQGISIGAMLQWAIYRIRTVALAEQNVELPPNWGEGDLLQVQINDRELGKLCHTLVTDPVEPLTEYLVGYAASGGGEEAGTGQPKPTGTSSKQRNSKVPAPKKPVTGTKSRVQAALKRVKSGRVEKKEKQTARPKTEPKQKKMPAKAKSGAGKKRAPPPQSKKVPLTPNWSQCQPSTSTSFSSPSSPNSKAEPPMPNISGGRLRKPVDRYIAPVWTARK